MNESSFKIEAKQFHQLLLNELYELLKLRVDVFVVEQACAYKELDDKDQEAIHLLLRVETELIAYARIIFEHGKLHIGRIIVAPDFRGKNFGYEMINQAIDYCQLNFSDHQIYISAQYPLEQYYQQFGFVTISEKPYDWDGIPHVDMVHQTKSNSQ